MQKTKKEQGITLVALIITVIILIILAAVSIAALVNSNFIGIAIRGTEEYSNAQDYEGALMQGLRNLVKDVVANISAGGTGAGGDENGGDDDEENLPPNGAKEQFTAEDATPIEYGVYVDYSKDIDGVTENDYNDWQVFYVGEVDVDESGTKEHRIFLKAADYVKNEKITLAEQAGLTKNGDYSVYWNTEPTSLHNMLQKSLFMYGVGTYYDLTSSYNNSKCVSTLLNTDNWINFVDDRYADYAIGGPTLSMWVDSWNAKGYQPIYFNEMNSYGYYCGTSSSPTTCYAYVSGDTGYSDTTYFQYHTDVGTENCNCYWLASPSAYADNRVFVICCDGSMGNNGNTAKNVRCVPRSFSKSWCSINLGQCKKCIYYRGY